MRRLLLLLVLPYLLQASDDKPAYSNGQKAAIAATCATSWSAAAYTGAIGGTKLMASLWVGDVFGAGAAVFGMVSSTGSIIKGVNTACDLIEGKPEGSPLQIAAAESAMRRRIHEENAATRFEACLSANARCRDLNAQGFSKRCNSPARNYAMINELATKSLIDRYKRNNTHNN